MTQVIYCDRSRYQSYGRCKRLRWLEYHEGPEGKGLVPKRRSIHLVIGGAYHAGMEVLLSEGQATLDSFAASYPESNLEEAINVLFSVSYRHRGVTRPTTAREIEDRAVAAALAFLATAFGEGVDLDPEEQRQREQAQAAGGMEIDFSDLLNAPLAGGPPSAKQEDSPIVIDFADFSPASTTSTNSPSILDSSSAIVTDNVIPSTSSSLQSTEAGSVEMTGSASVLPQGRQGGFSEEAWLREEVAALVEGMVRAWSRRRWRRTLEEFIVLEVEREGEWNLADVEFENDREWFCRRCPWIGEEPLRMLGNEYCPVCHYGGDEGTEQPHPSFAYSRGKSAELHFLSRHDALLLERSTGYLYLQSYKTTGSWDRRKELDAQVDMQGLSEAVDVEQRFGQWWHEIHREDFIQKYDVWAWGADTTVKTKAIYNFLANCSDPPTVLGVRYDYALKGSRKEDKKAQPGEPRWNQESILVRAYKQEGITSDDRRWAWTYDWQDQMGKSRRLDYRSWKKAPVWKFMPVAEWIDRLDRGEVQEDALGEGGELLDALREQFVPVLTQFRNRDESLDLLEQLEGQEVQIAKDVEEVRRAEREGGPGAKRSALNRLFPQTRTACSYPGLCAYRQTATQPGFCFGAPDPEHNAEVMERFEVRKPNHPQELVQIATGGNEGQ